MKKELQLETDPPAPELDLRFKEGETIKINMKITVRKFLKVYKTLNLVSAAEDIQG